MWITPLCIWSGRDDNMINKISLSILKLMIYLATINGIVMGLIFKSFIFFLGVPIMFCIWLILLGGLKICRI